MWFCRSWTIYMRKLVIGKTRLSPPITGDWWTTRKYFPIGLRCACGFFSCEVVLFVKICLFVKLPHREPSREFFLFVRSWERIRVVRSTGLTEKLPVRGHSRNGPWTPESYFEVVHVFVDKLWKCTQFPLPFFSVQFSSFSFIFEGHLVLQACQTFPYSKLSDGHPASCVHH